MALIKSISGIRGTIGGNTGENLTPQDVVKFTAAYGSWVLEKKTGRKIVIGRDGRISGPMIQQLVTSTLMGMGLDVVDIGLSTIDQFFNIFSAALFVKVTEGLSPL